METARLSLTQIRANDSFNSRKTYRDDEIETLADDIENHGQLNPLLVSVAAGGKYDLIAGFKRFRALKLVNARIEEHNRTADEKKKKEPLTAFVQVASFKNEADKYMTNLAENVLRSNLTGYEIAERAAYLSDEFGMTANDIGKRLTKDNRYISNLIRAYRKVIPEIREAWKNAGNDEGTLPWNFVLRMAALDDSEQKEAWDERVKATSPLGALTGDSDEKEDKGKKGPQRASAVTLDSARKAVKESKKSDAWKEGALAALAFALGLKREIPGVYKPEKGRPKKGAAAKDDGGKADKGRAEKGAPVKGKSASNAAPASA